MSAVDKETAEFAKALKRLPPLLSCFSDGAGCPWCGFVHRSVTFGKNHCEECARPFLFGYPEWREGEDPVSWVEFPWAEFDALGGRADLLPEWRPNERLRHHYFHMAEEQLGVSAHDHGRQ